MKKMCAIVAAMIAFSTVSTITIFADEVQQKLPAIEKAVKELPEMKQLEQNDAALESQYTTKSGTIKSIEKENNYYTISVALPDDEFGIVYTADANAFIVNSENGNFMTFDELQNDMKISAVISKYAPMTMSLPPITNAIGFVVGEENFVATGYFDEEWTSKDTQPMLQLNISEQTKIVDMAGSKKIFTQEDLKNQDCLVVYGATTRSIPAQTNPVFVMILDKQEIEEEEVIDTIQQQEMTEKETQTEQKEILFTPLAPPETEPPVDAGNFVPLREIAENKGFTVTWTANDKPVLLQKDDTTIEITVGQKDYKKNGAEFSSCRAFELLPPSISSCSSCFGSCSCYGGGAQALARHGRNAANPARLSGSPGGRLPCQTRGSRRRRLPGGAEPLLRLPAPLPQPGHPAAVWKKRCPRSSVLQTALHRRQRQREPPLQARRFGPVVKTPPRPPARCVNYTDFTCMFGLRRGHFISRCLGHPDWRAVCVHFPVPK